MSVVFEEESSDNWETVTNPKKEQRRYQPVYYSFFRPTAFFRCVTGIPGKNQIIAVANSRSDPPVRRDLRSTLDMNEVELKCLFGGFLQAARRRADEVRMSEHHGSLRSRKEFHVHFMFSHDDFSSVCTQAPDRFRLQELEDSRRAKLMIWAEKDLENAKREILRLVPEDMLDGGPESEVVHRSYHPKYARICFTTSCDFFGFSRTFSLVKRYIEYFKLENFHLITSYNYIQIAMTCDEYVKHTLGIKGNAWTTDWLSKYEKSFREEDRGTILDS